MVKGIKKIIWDAKDEAVVISNLSIPNKLLVINPKKTAWFKVDTWFPSTTELEKKKNVTWMFQNQNKSAIILQKTIISSSLYGINLPKNLCGSYTYFLDASTTGKSNKTDSVGLYIRGHCPALVVNSKWAVKNDGEDVRKSKVFSYGNIIHLNLGTEGLNGDILTVEVYNKQLGDDNLFQIYTDVKVIDGEVNLEIKNTSTWKAKIRNIADTEEFYVYVKHQTTGKYILDANKDKAHARFLRIKNELVAYAPKPPQNNTPAKVGVTTIRPDRYDPCKFEKIEIIETEKKDGKETKINSIIFDNGKNIANKERKLEPITKSIHFDFDNTTINAEETLKLSNVLGFLLEHEYSNISLNGYACVIGKENYNLDLSQKRSDSIKKFLVNGKLDATRIISIGKGEINATDDKAKGDDIKYKNEEKNINARRVDITFNFLGHDASSIIYETVAPSNDKNLTINVINYQTKACFRENNKHKKKIKITSPQYKAVIEKEVSTLAFPVHAALSSINPAPIQYIWPKWNLINGLSNKGIDSANIYNAHVHSCRYYSNENTTTAIIKAYPDIKWNLQLSFNFANAAAYTHSNLPEYSRKNPKDEKVQEIIRNSRKAQSKAVASGKETIKVLEKNSPEMLTKFELKLEAKWNDEQSKLEISKEFAEKIRKVLGIFIKYKEIADKVKTKIGGAAKNSLLKPPFMFEVQSPSLNANIDWYLEKGKDKYANKVATVGKLNFKADPLIGAEFTIDLLAVGSRMHPFVAALIAGTEIALSALNGGIIFEAKFYGKLEFDFNAIEINSLTGMKVGAFDMGAKLGLDIKLKISFEVKIKAWIMEVEVKLRAEAAAKAHFAAKIKIDSDEKGIFYKPEIGFSGLIFTFEAEIVVGGFKRMLKFGNDKEPFLKADVPNLEKHYII